MPADEPAQSAADPIQQRFQTALETLATGDFGGARPIFGELIQAFPTDLEYLCGYYAAGWWFNREERRSTLKEGRALADWLMNEWEAFQDLADSRNYAGCLSYRATMRAVLGEAAAQYRIAFQEESGSVDTGLLKTLATCLIRLEDYANAADVLLYARRRNNRSDAQLYFLLGEAMCSQNRDDLREKGVSFYRDACLADSRALDPGLMSSQPASGVFEELYEASEHNLDRTIEWFPAHLHARSMAIESLRRLSSAEIDYLRSEATRLARDLNQVVEKYRDRVRANLAFFYLCLIHHYRYHEKDRTTANEFEDRLKSIVPEIYTIYRDHLP